MLRLSADEEIFIKQLADNNNWESAPDEDVFYSVLDDMMSYSDDSFRPVIKAYVDGFKSYSYPDLSHLICEIISADYE